MRSRLFSVLKCIGICLDWILCVMAQCLWLKTWRYTMPLMHTEEKENTKKGFLFPLCVLWFCHAMNNPMHAHDIALWDTFFLSFLVSHTDIAVSTMCSTVPRHQWHWWRGFLFRKRRLVYYRRSLSSDSPRAREKWFTFRSGFPALVLLTVLLPAQAR